MSVPVPRPASSESPLPACVSPRVFASPPPVPVSTPSSLSSHGLFEYFLPNILWFPESPAPPLPSPLLHPGPLSNGWGARRFSWARGLLMTCLPQRPRLPLTPGPVSCTGCHLPQPHLCFLPSQVWRHQRKGRLTPLPTAGPGPLCTSALGLVWALGQTLLRGPGGTGHRPTPITPPPPKGLFLPGALLAFCEGAWTRLEGSGVSAFC